MNFGTTSANIKVNNKTMSLEATHIRFALDLQNKYKIKDIDQYISGAIYPDSRYVTGINRELTHDDRFLLPEFVTDDFKAGWQTHQICDLVYNAVRKRLFVDLFPVSYDSYNEQEWILSTAMKIIQDMDDMQAFDIQKYLKFLEYSHNPNSEDITEVKNYNNIMISLYKNKEITTVEENISMWLALGPEASLCEQVRVKTEEFLKDPLMLSRIKSIYREMVNSYSDVANKRILDKFSGGKA